MNLKTYADVTLASDVLEDVAIWEDAEPEVQQSALSWAAVYMQSVYSIPEPLVGSNPIELVTANALLASHHLDTNLFTTVVSFNPPRGLTEKSVKAGDVESSTKYDPQISKQWVDPFPDITAFLGNAGYKIKKGNTVKTVVMQR